MVIQMLVIVRKIGESLRVGNQVVITIADCKNEAVKIGIDAPKDVLVHRAEIYNKAIELTKID